MVAISYSAFSCFLITLLAVLLLYVLQELLHVLYCRSYCMLRITAVVCTAVVCITEAIACCVILQKLLHFLYCRSCCMFCITEAAACFVLQKLLHVLCNMILVGISDPHLTSHLSDFMCTLLQTGDVLSMASFRHINTRHIISFKFQQNVLLKR